MKLISLKRIFKHSCMALAVITAFSPLFNSCSTSKLNLNYLVGGAQKALQAATVSDRQIQEYVEGGKEA